MTRAALAFGFTKLQLPLIGAFTHPDNAASNRVLVKCSFRVQGYEPRLARNYYQIEREEWQAG